MKLTPADLEYIRQRLDAAPPETVERVPHHTLEPIREYMLTGNPYFGSFLEAVLTNDLIGAVRNADTNNRAALADIVVFLCSYCPASAFGSREAVERYGRAVRDLTAVVEASS